MYVNAVNNNTMGFLFSKPYPPLTDHQLEELHRHTPRFSKTHIKHLYDRFMSHNATGFLPKGLFQSHWNWLRVEGSQWNDALFRNFDKDSNGNITFPDYLIAMDLFQNGSASELTDYIFSTFDPTKSGLIHYDTLVKMFTELQPLIWQNSGYYPEYDVAPARLAREIFRQAGKMDSETVLTLEEYLSYTKSAKSSADETPVAFQMFVNMLG